MLNHLRVVLNSNKDDTVDHNETFRNNTFKCESRSGLNRNRNDQKVSTSNTSNPLEPINNNSEYNKMKTEILLVNDRPPQLNVISTENDEGPSTTISRKIHFNDANASNIEMIKREFALVMDLLLAKCQYSCIMRFFDFFVTFINKRIYHQKYKLQYFKFKCLDAAASLKRTKIPPTEMASQGEAKLVLQGFNSGNDCNNNSVAYRLPRNAKNEFHSTRNMLVWLLNEYRLQFADSKEDEKLRFLFSTVDRHQNMFKVEFLLCKIFVNLMNIKDRGHKGVDCNFIHSGLTISLSSHIETILPVFYIPTNIKMTAETMELFQTAFGVMQNGTIKKLASIREKVEHNFVSVQTSNDCIRYPFQKQNEGPQNDIPLNKKLLRALSSLSASYNLNDTPFGSFCGQKFHTLSSWYRKIDECFENTCQLREEYFDYFFKYKIKEISSNIKNMCKTLESLYPEQTDRDLIEMKKDYTELQQSFERYRSAETLFYQLTEDIKGSNFEPILKVYLETKISEFNNNTSVLKQKNLEWSQRHLNITFDYIFTDLKLPI